MEVITKNPGVLACNPVGLKQSSASDVKRAAAVVDAVEALPLWGRYAIPSVLIAGVTWLVGTSAYQKAGAPDLVEIRDGLEGVALLR